jgi:hypothetical protein
MARVEMAPNWEQDVLAAWDKLAEDRLGPDITADAVRYAPVGHTVVYDPAHPRTPAHEAGELRRSIGHRMDGHRLIVEATAPYAAYVELGTSPHEITAHGPWSLRSGVTGQYFGSHVHHPGTRPMPFLRPAVWQHRHP